MSFWQCCNGIIAGENARIVHVSALKSHPDFRWIRTELLLPHSVSHGKAQHPAGATSRSMSSDNQEIQESRSQARATGRSLVQMRKHWMRIMNKIMYLCEE